MRHAIFILFSSNEQHGGRGDGGGAVGVRCQTFSFVLFSLFSRPRAELATVQSSFFGLTTNTLNVRLPDIILLGQCYYHRGTRLNAMKRFCIYFQPMIPPERFDISLPDWGMLRRFRRVPFFFKEQP